MQKSPLVSIIIPTYNNASVVCHAVDCSLHQTYENVEVIVVDDGSTDGTEEVLKNKYQDRIIYVRQKNRGTGGARNTGIRHSSGKYLQFLDADDLLDLDKITTQIDHMGRIDVKTVSYCDYSCCDIDDMTVVYKRISPVMQNEKPFNDIMLKWETELTIPVHCFLFDAALFKENGIAFDESLQANEDWECWMNVFAQEPKVFFVDRVLVCYRVRKDSRCRNRVKMRKSYLTAIDKQISKNRLNEEVLESLYLRKAQIKYLYRDVNLLSRLIKLCPPLVKNIFTRIVPWRIRNRFQRLYA